MAELVEDGYERSALPDEHKAVLAYMDVFLRHPATLPAGVRDDLRAHFSEEQIVEGTIYAAVASGLSRLLIVLGAEPEDRPIAVAPVEQFFR